MKSVSSVNGLEDNDDEEEVEEEVELIIKEDEDEGTRTKTMSVFGMGLSHRIVSRTDTGLVPPNCQVLIKASSDTCGLEVPALAARLPYSYQTSKCASLQRVRGSVCELQ